MPLSSEFEQNSSLDELQQKLEQGTLTNVKLKRSRLVKEQELDSGSWPEEIIDDYGESSNDNSWKKIKKILIIAIVFFIASLSIASLVLLKGGNLISNSNINLDIRGPVSIKSGEVLHLQLAITNKNNANLEAARILATYPDGTRSALDVNQNLKRGAYELSNIKIGETINKSFDALVFGSQGSQQTVKFTLEYRLAGSNNVFTKEKDFIFAISDAPISLVVDFPEEMNAGREFQFSVNLVSNSPTILSDLLLDISYPPGFQFKNSDLQPLIDNHSWQLGNLASGDKKKITITGVLSGQENEAKSFRFMVGPSQNSADNKPAFVYGDIIKNLIIRNPFIGANLVVSNSNGSEVVVLPDERINGRIEWVNNLPVDLNNLRAELSLNGSIIERKTIKVEKGFYRSQDDKIIWDKTTLASMSNLSSGDNGRAVFSFSILPLTSLKGNLARNPQAKLNLILIGERQTNNNQAEQVKTEINKIIKVASVPQIATQMFYHSGPFTNSGTTNPKVNKPTTYTINWSIANPSNEVKDVKVVATLPNYVDWLATFSPQSENISYNESTRQIVWEAGVIPAGTGFESTPKEVYFQVSFTPSLSQLNIKPIIVSETKLTGVDSFTSTIVSSSKTALTTGSLNEPDLGSESGVVEE